MTSTLIWAVAILAFGVLLMVCILLLLGRQAALPVEVAGKLPGQKGEYLQHLNRLLRAIRTINSLILAERDMTQLLEKACRSLTTTRGYRMAWVGFVQDGTKRVRPVAQAGFEEGYLEGIQITWDDSPMGQGPTGRAIKAAEPCVMRDIETAPEFSPWRQQALERGYRSSAALPLRFRGQVLGTLNVYAEIPDAFDIEEVGLLQEVADHLAYALGSIRLEGELATARQQVEQAERIRAAFDHAPLGIMVTDKDGVITNVNPRMMEFLDGRQSPQDLVGRLKLGDLELFRPPAMRTHVERVLREGRPVEFDCLASVAGGRTYRLHCRGTPVTEADKGLTEAVWLVEDTSGRGASGPG